MTTFHMTSVHAERGGTFDLPDGHTIYAVVPNPSRSTEVLVFHGDATDGQRHTDDDVSPEEWLTDQVDELTLDDSSAESEAASGGDSLADVVGLGPDAPLDEVPGIGETTLDQMHVDPADYTAGDLPPTYLGLAELLGKDAADTIARFADGVEKP